MPPFFFNDTATTEIYTLSLHDALPISGARLPGGDGRDDGERDPGRARQPARRCRRGVDRPPRSARDPGGGAVKRLLRSRRAAFGAAGDRESTRPESRHRPISYAPFFF